MRAGWLDGHGFFLSGQIARPRAGLASALFDELHLRWYDRWLRSVDNGLDTEAPLRIFVMGGGSGRRSGAGRLVHGGNPAGQPDCR